MPFVSVQGVHLYSCIDTERFIDMTRKKIKINKNEGSKHKKKREKDVNRSWKCCTRIKMQTRILINKSSSSLSCRAASTDIPDPLSPRLPIIHRLRLVFIPYPHIAAVCIFELVVLLLIGHMRGSTGARHLRSRPCFSSSVQHVWFV